MRFSLKSPVAYELRGNKRWHGNMQIPSQRTSEPFRDFHCLMSYEPRYANTFPNSMNDAARQMEEKPPTTFVILNLLDSEVEYDYFPSI